MEFLARKKLERAARCKELVKLSGSHSLTGRDDLGRAQRRRLGGISDLTDRQGCTENYHVTENFIGQIRQPLLSWTNYRQRWIFILLSQTLRNILLKFMFSKVYVVPEERYEVYLKYIALTNISTMHMLITAYHQLYLG